jgi:hypothetical protein
MLLAIPSPVSFRVPRLSPHPSPSSWRRGVVLCKVWSGNEEGEFPASQIRIKTSRLPFLISALPPRYCEKWNAD